MTTVPAGKAPAARRFRLWLPVALMAGAQLWLSSQSRLPVVSLPAPGFDKLLHAVWFLVLGLLAYRAGRLSEGWSRGRTATILLLAALVWGAGDEWHQSFVPGRAVEAVDLAADLAGVAIGVLVAEPLFRRLGSFGASR